MVLEGESKAHHDVLIKFMAHGVLVQINTHETRIHLYMCVIVSICV